MALSGATRLFVIVGHPIAQARSPGGISAGFAARGHDAVLVPCNVAPGDLDAWFEGVSRTRNLDGIVVTVPHKLVLFPRCASSAPRAGFLGAVNMMRRNRDGTWHGDMSDGLSMLAALRAKGGDPRGKAALLIGAGGAGSAIAHALIEAGLARLGVFDSDALRQANLCRRLAGLGRATVQAVAPEARGYDLVINATPLGMRADDPSPLPVDGLLSTMLVGDVVTLPEVPPFVAAARSRGCVTVTGSEMFDRVRDLVVDFMLGGARLDAP
ncbi:MAG: ThiF family adenylyltransferase [Burkholderiales bacterium]|nr:ThiF family adenylyltransferase [Burkholderiales bacterium]